jgi:hypothetical protein
MLIEAASPWRLDWLGRGLYADGWTRPGRDGVVRVFSRPDQRRAATRSLSLGFRAPEDVSSREVNVSSNLGHVAGQAMPNTTLHEVVRICVPPDGYTDVRLHAVGLSPLPPDLRGGHDTEIRKGGVLVTEVALSDELGPPCKP